jgi:hypothetical protein
MDTRRAPVGIVGLHAPNQRSDFLADFGLADAAGTETPEQSEVSAVSGNDGFGLYDNERARPAAPHTPDYGSKEPVDLAESGAGLLPFEHDELLAKSGGFQPELVARNKVRANIGESGENEPDHHSDVIRNGIARSFANYSFTTTSGLMTDREVCWPLVPLGLPMGKRSLTSGIGIYIASIGMETRRERWRACLVKRSGCAGRLTVSA